MRRDLPIARPPFIRKNGTIYSRLHRAHVY